MNTNREQRINFQQGLIDAGHITTCTNCEHWALRTVIGEEDLVEIQLCRKCDQTPPPDVIVVGCEEWVYNIPF